MSNTDLFAMLYLFIGGGMFFSGMTSAISEGRIERDFRVLPMLAAAVVFTLFWPFIMLSRER